MTETNAASVLIDITEHIAHVQLNRPEKSNALHQDAWQALQTSFVQLDQDERVRVIVLSGIGRNFCAGIDLNLLMSVATQFTSQDEGRKREQLRAQVHRLQAPINAIEACRKPVLAAIQRACVGGGVDLISACDMRYGTQDAFFAIEETNVGMVADLGTLQRLPTLVGEGIAREWAFTGRRVPADEAQRVGLINAIYPDHETLLNEVMAIAARIATQSPLAVRGIKQVMNFSRDHSVATSLEYIATWNAAMLLSNDIQEALRAKFAGETPHFED